MSYPLDFSYLPGSQAALIRVTVSDGVNSASDTSDAVFSVRRKPPEVAITWPLPGALYESDQAVLFEADVRDLEDASLPEANMMWTSDLMGVLGTGSSIASENLVVEIGRASCRERV